MTRKERSFADVISQGKVRKTRIFMGDSVIWKVNKVINKGEEITACLPGANIEAVAEKVEVMGWDSPGFTVDTHSPLEILLLVYLCLYDMAPQYLADLLNSHSVTRSLRSAEQQLLVVSRSKLKRYGERSFKVVAPYIYYA